MPDRTMPRLRRLVAGFVVAAFLSACGSADPETVSVVFPGGTGSAQPRLTADLDGNPVISWLEPDGRQRALKFARYESDGFGPVREVVRSERMFVNWADFPSVTQIDEHVWFAHWPRRRAGSGAYDVAATISRDGGSTWFPAEQMNEDEAVAEHGFVSVFPWGDSIAAFWLDGRQLANWSFDDPDALLGTSLRLARYDRAGLVASREVIDEIVCDCCQPDVAMTDDGPVVAYRDRTEEEIRDVVVRRFADDGWTDALALGNEGWRIEGCPVNGPAIAARGNDVAVAWFTAHDNRGHVRFARSSDGGRSFSSPIAVDDDGAYGQVGIVLDDDDRAVVSWWRRAEQGGIDLKVRAFEPDGDSRDLTIAHESLGQPADVPQLIAAGDAYLVAWSTFDDGGTVRLVRVDIPR